MQGPEIKDQIDDKVNKIDEQKQEKAAEQLNKIGGPNTIEGAKLDPKITKGQIVNVGGDIYVVTSKTENMSYKKSEVGKKGPDLVNSGRFEYYMADANASTGKTADRYGQQKADLEAFVKQEITNLVNDPATDWDNVSIVINGSASNISYTDNSSLPTKRAEDMKSVFLKNRPTDKKQPDIRTNIVTSNAEKPGINGPKYPPESTDMISWIKGEKQFDNKPFKPVSAEQWPNFLKDIGATNQTREQSIKALCEKPRDQANNMLEKWVYSKFQYSESKIGYQKLEQKKDYAFNLEKTTKYVVDALSIHSYRQLYAENPNYSKTKDLDPKYPDGKFSVMYMQINPDRNTKTRNGTGYRQGAADAYQIGPDKNKDNKKDIQDMRTSIADPSIDGIMNNFNKTVMANLEKGINLKGNDLKDPRYTYLNTAKDKNARTFKAKITPDQVKALEGLMNKQTYTTENVGYENGRKSEYAIDRSQFDNTRVDDVNALRDVGIVKFIKDELVTKQILKQSGQETSNQSTGQEEENGGQGSSEEG